MLDVLVMAGDLGYDARRPHVESLERWAEHALDPRELEDHVGFRVLRGHLALRERAYDCVRRCCRQGGTLAADESDVARLPHRPDGVQRLLNALEPHRWVALDQNTQRTLRQANANRRRRDERVL